MEKKIIKQLTRFGFTQQQARLYLAGLKLGDCLMINLAHKAKVKRSTAYYAIDELKRRGFFSTKKIGKRTYYSAASSKKLVDMTTERLKFVKKLSPILNNISKKTLR